MTDDQKKLIGDAAISLEMTVAEFSDLLYMLNVPLSVPTVTWASYIDKIQSQVAPQVKKLEDSLRELKTTS